jgi:dipeptidyl aminopeptidase/acylaminoacyl peptidase
VRSPLRAALSFALLWVAGDTVASRFHPEDVFGSPSITQVSVSPAGDWIVALASQDDVEGLLVQRRGDGIVIPIYSTRREIHWLEWIGDNTVFLRQSRGDDLQATVIRLEWNGHTAVHDEFVIRRKGSLVDPLVDEDEVVLWALDGRKGSRVVRGPVTALSPHTKWKLSGEKGGGKLEKVAQLDQPVALWQVDRKGVVRAALILDDLDDPGSELALKYRRGEDARWRTVWKGPQEDAVVPVGTTRDDARLIVAAYGGSDTRGLYEFDPDARKIAGTIFVRPGVDIVDAVFDYDAREIIAAVYEDGGERRYHYLNGFREKHLANVADLAPAGQSVSVASASRDHRIFALLVRGARHPGTFYFFDKETRERIRLGEVLPRVVPDRLADVDTLEVVSPDGTELEAFFAQPAAGGAGPPPLLVLPHGGPIGVRDDLSFDPLLQYIVLDGVAVLKVNYRGSSGYGRTFLEAGKREWSRGIEDDIDAAVDAVVERGLVDPGRICVAGGSYGGYSALVIAIRRPDRFRCVATLNGVTDVPLLFQSSDFAATREGRRELAEIVGDPETEFDRLLAISPVYQVEKLRSPVLIAHGTKDVRVDPDHAHRLRAMLAAHGKPYEWHEIRGGRHSPTEAEWRAYALKLRAFLREHLKRDSGSVR